GTREHRRLLGLVVAGADPVEQTSCAGSHPTGPGGHLTGGSGQIAAEGARRRPVRARIGWGGPGGQVPALGGWHRSLRSSWRRPGLVGASVRRSRMIRAGLVWTGLVLVLLVRARVGSRPGRVGGGSGASGEDRGLTCLLGALPPGRRLGRAPQ